MAVAVLGGGYFITERGVEQTRERGLLLAAQAERRLAMVGPHAKVLLDAVDFIVERQY